jgi:hypothetical protein
MLWDVLAIAVGHFQGGAGYAATCMVAIAICDYNYYYYYED